MLISTEKVNSLSFSIAVLLYSTVSSVLLFVRKLFEKNGGPANSRLRESLKCGTVKTVQSLFA